MDEYKPAYKLRKEDFVPFKNIDRHARRCAIEAARLDAATRGDYGTESEYYIKSLARGVFLGIYDIAIVATPVIGATIGLSKFLQ